MKPYHFSTWENHKNRNESFVLRSDTWKPGVVETYVETGSYVDMKTLAEQLNAELAEHDYKNKRFTRYITNWYVTIDAAECERLCRIDRTTSPGVTENVELIHNHGFALWGDGKITKSVSDAPSFYGIAECASRLINSLRGSDTGGANVAGGMLRLAQIVEIEESRGVYNSPKIKKFNASFSDGTQQTLFSTEEGYFEGYAYDIYDNPIAALSHSATGVQGVTDFSDYKYDPELGYMKGV